MKQANTQEDLHGISQALYANTPLGLIATLTCLCGRIFDGGTRYWADAGYALDEHLNEIEDSESDTR